MAARETTAGTREPTPELAQQEGISISQFTPGAVAEKVAPIDTQGYLLERAQRGSRARLLAVLAKAPDVEPEEADKLPGM